MSPSDNIERSARESAKKYMLEIFRRAIPEIDPETELVSVHSNPWISPDGEEIELHNYDISVPGDPFPRGYRFTIAYLPESKRVLMLEIPLFGLEGEKRGEYYIVLYSTGNAKFMSPFPKSSPPPPASP